MSFDPMPFDPMSFDPMPFDPWSCWVLCVGESKVNPILEFLFNFPDNKYIVCYFQRLKSFQND